MAINSLSESGPINDMTSSKNIATKSGALTTCLYSTSQQYATVTPITPTLTYTYSITNSPTNYLDINLASLFTMS